MSHHQIKRLTRLGATVQPALELCQNSSPGSQREQPLLSCATDASREGTNREETDDEQDIPSHQFAQSESVSIESHQFNLTTPATTKPNSEHQESPAPGGNDTVETFPSPYFQSQLQPTVLFDLPDSSLSSAVQESPVQVAVAELAPVHGQDGQIPAAEIPSESQDAQILHHTDPQVELFIDSLENHNVDPSNRPPTTSSHSPCRSHSQTSQEPVLVTRMEPGAASESTESAPQPSAVDELSQILNLDNVLTDVTPTHDHPDSVLPGHAEHLSIPEIDSSLQEMPQQPPSRHPPVQESIGPENEGHRDSETRGQRQQSAAESLQSIVDLNFQNPNVPVPGTVEADASNGPELPTVSLADISRQPEMGPLPLMPSLMAHDDPFGSSGVSVPVGHPELDHESSDDSSDGSQEQMSLKHIVTLPFQASLRPAYDDTLLESKRAVTQFGASFNSELYVEPEEALVQQIDHLFSRLHNLCDYPPDALGSVLEDLPSNQLIKYCCDANPKFNFIYELLHRLTNDTRVLIVARSVDLLRLLCRMTDALEIECICEDIGKLKSEFAASAARVTLILPQRAASGDDYDVVIGFDHSFGSSRIGKSLEPQVPEAKSPLVLILVTTHSIEHIDHYIPEDLTLLERKNALLSGIVRSRQLVSDPERGYPEPHEIASLFLDYLNGQVEGIVWDPVPVPEEVMDIYLSSQTRSQMPTSGTPEPNNDRKRKHDEPDDEDAKRMRMLPHGQSTVQTNRAPLPDDVKAILGSVDPGETAIKSSQVHVNVSLATLQALAEQHAEMRRQLDAADRDPQYQSLISGLETRVKEYERTNAKIYASQRGALEDRSKFQQEARKAEAALQQVVETSQKDAEKSLKTIANLQATVARLMANPNGGEEETPLARTQKLFQEAQDKVQMLEKRLENAHKDADYARSLYQDATMSSGALRGENADLKEQVSDLSKKTEETLGKVHKLQSENVTKQYLRQIRDLKALVREREIELDCTREELRQLKNGRRETRQVSVPRSPRMGLMSPRTGRAAYGTGGGGSTSRGTSPTPASTAEGTGLLPGAQFMGQQPGNGRWNHLRD